MNFLSAPVIIGGIVVLLLIFLWATYNSLVTLRERIREAFSSIDIQLKRRTDLIPNLIETVKGYAKHEKSVFEEVTKARSNMMKAESPQEKAEANNMMTSALKTLFAVAEAYPELKASDNFKHLQEELSDTEDKIAYSRQFYNSNVLSYNTKLKTVPTVFIANMFGFKPEEFFETEPGEREPVKVDFTS
jgi:LemA protein